MNLFSHAIQQSLKNLEVTGCKYTVTTPEGETYTNVEPAKRTRLQTVPMGTYSKLYKPVIDTLEPEELRLFLVPDDIDIESFRSAMAAYASTKFGKKKLATEVSGRQVRMMLKAA